MVAARILLRIGLLVGIVLILAGCMQALHEGSGAGSSQSSLSWPKPLAIASKTPAPEEVSHYRTQQSAMEVSPQDDETPAPEEEPATEETQPAPQGEPDTVEVASAPLPSATIPPTPIPPTFTVALPSPTPTIEQVVVLPPPPPMSKEELWHAQQQEREVFTSHRLYTTTSSDLWWYDHVNEQHVILGSFSGQFEAQAQFILAKDGQQALEVPYHVNESYGLEALSPVLMERIDAAGYHSGWIETYVILNDQVQPIE